MWREVGWRGFGSLWEEKALLELQVCGGVCLEGGVRGVFGGRGERVCMVEGVWSEG